MTDWQRCSGCGGSGKVMGGGFMMGDCAACKGLGKIALYATAEDELEMLAAANKPKTKKQAKKELMAELKISAEEAEQLLESA